MTEEILDTEALTTDVASSPAHTTIDELTPEKIIQATVEAFNNAQTNKTRGLSMSLPKLKGGYTLYLESMPYKAYRDICCMLCEMETDICGDKEKKINSYTALDQILPNGGLENANAEKSSQRVIRMLDIEDITYIKAYKNICSLLDISPTLILHSNQERAKVTFLPPEEQRSTPSSSNSDNTQNNISEQFRIAAVKEAVRKSWNETFCTDFSEEEVDSESKKRSNGLVPLRQASMYFCLRVLGSDISTTQIGKKHGNRDHTTAIHSFKVVSNWKQGEDALLTKLIEKVSERLNCTAEQIERLNNPDLPRTGSQPKI